MQDFFNDNTNVENVSPTVGLSAAEAQARLEAGQGNAAFDNESQTVTDIIRSNVFTYFNLIFAVLAVLVIISGSFHSLTFLPVVIANTLIGIVQQVHAKKVLDNLTLMNAPVTKVLRESVVSEVPSEQLVLGDVIVLNAGDQIPADAKVIEGEISVNEALLTGEADEIVKTPQGETDLMSGSFVVSGEAKAVLTAVGADSYINRLSQKARSMSGEEESDMVKSIDWFVKIAGIVIIPIGIILVYQGLAVNEVSFQSAIISMVAAVIGMIPEGLYLLVSVTLAVSAVKLARQQVMLHSMKSIESLARVDTICVDKTGTITDNKMLVADFVAANAFSDEQLHHYIDVVTSYINVLPDNNQTMQALRNYMGTDVTLECDGMMPFTSRLKYSSVRFGDEVYAMGAPDIVMKNCFEDYRSTVEEYSAKGLRVLVFALVHDDIMPTEGIGTTNVLPIFFILLQNPIRKNAPETFEYFRQQGVRVMVISGDAPLTVSEVAKKAKIPNGKNYINAQTLTDEAKIQDAVRKYTVFGRVTPEQKQQIVRALQKDGHTVAMTGDGVNDILAMKDADCSIAMAAGSDAAVQAAKLVLLDDDFSHMPAVVGEGRRVVNNIQRSATLFLVKNIFSFMLAIFTIVSVVSYPLTPAQISLISTFTIGTPAFLLALEPNKLRIEGQFMKNVVFKAMPAALTDFIAIAALVVFGYVFKLDTGDISVAATFLMTIVGFIILYNISAPLNRYRWVVLIGDAIALVTCIMYLHSIFDVTSVSLKVAMLFLVFAVATLPIMMALTAFFNKVASIDRHWQNRKSKKANV